MATNTTGMTVSQILRSRVELEDEPKKKSREDWRKAKELEEARTFIKNKHYSENLEKEVTQEIYEEISDSRIAKIIKEHHDIKVTEQLIESYVELASSKLFTVDPVVQKIRALNKLDSIIENKLDYTLADGTVVAINEETQQELNKLFEDP